MKNFIEVKRPTKDIMRIARENFQMVLTFIMKPDEVVDVATSRAFQEGWLLGLGLQPNERLALVLIPKNVDFKAAKLAYLAQLEGVGTHAMQPWMSRSYAIEKRLK